MAYNLLRSVQVITDGDMSQSTITSSIIEIKNQDNVGIQLSWTGTPVGTFDVQISINHNEDYSGPVLTPGSFVSLTLSPAITASGGPDSAYIDLNQLSAQYIKIVYTRTSGSGTLNAHMAAKGV